MVPSCSPSPLFSNKLEFAGIKVTAGLLDWDIGVLAQPASDKPAYGDFEHGRQNEPDFSPTFPPAPHPWGLRS